MDIEKRIHAVEMKRYDLDWGHDCDCKFCDREGEDMPADTEKKAAAIDNEVEDLKELQRRLVVHAKLHGIKIINPKVKQNEKATV